jgi:hypothetical protein
MTVRTLAEAAAEVLNKSRSTAAKEPMHTMPHQVVDLGGSTLENPEGNSVGHAAAAHMGKAEEPGTKPASDSREGMKKLKGHPEDHEGHELVHPEHENGPGVSTAGHEYMHPTMEEEEFDEEEIIDEEFEELSEEELEEARKHLRHKMMEKMKHHKMEEDMGALFDGENLSEEFKTKATTIFESAVSARAVSVVEEMEQDILAAAEESVEEIKTELEEQIDSYLNYMVEEWVNENQVAIDSGLRAEIAEDFISGLKNLFAEHYIDVPEEKADVLEAMAEEIDELKSRLNESLNANIELSEAIVEARKSEIVSSVCEGLTATQAGKVKALAEGVEFTTEGEYVKKMQVIRENYFKSEPTKVKQETKQIQLTESESVVVPADVSPSMESYLRAIRRTSPL